MMLIKNSWKKIKENFVLLFLFEALFLLLNAAYVIMLKSMLSTYLTTFQSLTSNIEAVQRAANVASQNAQLEQLLTTIGPSTQTIMLLLFVITPIVVIGLWVLFQGLIWKRLHPRPIPTATYARQCAIATLIIFALAAIISRIGFTPLIVLLGFLLYYFLTVIYVSTEHLTWGTVGKKIIAPGLRYLHHWGPYILLLSLSSASLLFMTSMFVLSFTIKEWIFLSPVWFILYSILLIILNLSLKAVVSLKIHQSEGG